MRRRSTPEEDQRDRELGGFDVRTTIDDTIGKLMFVRDRIFMEVPEGLHGLLHDIDEAVENVLPLVEDLPEPPYPGAGHFEQPSASRCLGEACSCGMPSWSWEPPASAEKEPSA